MGAEGIGVGYSVNFQEPGENAFKEKQALTRLYPGYPVLRRPDYHWEQCPEPLWL